MEYYFQRYGDLELQRRMVSDRWRTDAFAAAITAAVRPGDVVLDVGTGTGVLAMLAARAGAKVVYAIDQAEIVKTAANLVKANGLEDRVKIMRGPAGELALPEPVDLIISEWLGHMAFVENMLDDVLAARDANLKPGGRMLPAQVAVRLAPVGDPVLYHHDGPGFWRRPVHGLDFSSLETLELRQGRVLQTRIEPATLLGPAATLVDLDIAEAEPDDAYTAGSTTLEITQDGVLSGFAGWFDCTLAPGVRLDTGPRQPETHWSQSAFAFPPRTVRRGDRLTLEWVLDRHADEPRYMQVGLTLDGDHQVYVVE